MSRNSCGRHKHTTLQLLWEEYREAHPDGYRYSKFCYHYQQWKRQRDVVMRGSTGPARSCLWTWAGDTIAVRDPHSGGMQRASLFVAVLGASNYTYAEGTVASVPVLRFLIGITPER